MALRDYSNGADPGLANLINNINDNEVRRQNAERAHLETMGKVGLAFALGTLLQKFFESRRR